MRARRQLASNAHKRRLVPFLTSCGCASVLYEATSLRAMGTSMRAVLDIGSVASLPADQSPLCMCLDQTHPIALPQSPRCVALAAADIFSTRQYASQAQWQPMSHDIRTPSLESYQVRAHQNHTMHGERRTTSTAPDAGHPPQAASATSTSVEQARMTV